MKNSKWQVRLIEKRAGQIVPAPVDSEFCETLSESREHAQVADVMIFAPGALVGRDDPQEVWLNGNQQAIQ